jgi:hypothetical protein
MMGALKTPPKLYRKQVEDILRKYPLYKQALKFRLYPSVTMDYSVERVEGGEKEYASSTEKYGVIRADYSQLVEQVEATMELLTEEEKRVIELAYFNSVSFVWEVIGWSRANYYNKRNSALEKMAIAFDLV